MIRLSGKHNNFNLTINNLSYNILIINYEIIIAELFFLKKKISFINNNAIIN